MAYIKGDHEISRGIRSRSFRSRGCLGYTLRRCLRFPTFGQILVGQCFLRFNRFRYRGFVEPRPSVGMYYLALRDDLQLLVYAPQYPIICAVSRRCLCITFERIGQIERDSGTAVFFRRQGSRLRLKAQYWPAREAFVESAAVSAAS